MKNLNLFGTELNFNHGGSSQYKTSFGFVLSVIFLIVASVLLSLLGRDFYKRQNPKTRYTETKNFYPFYDLKNSTFDFMIRIEDEDGNFFASYDTLFNITADYYNAEKGEDGNYNFDGSETLEISICNNSHIDSSEFRQAFNLSQFLCINNKNLSMGGFWDHSKLQYLNFGINLCNQEEDKNCNKTIDQEQYLIDNYFYIAIYFQEAVVNTEKYEDSLYISSKTIYYSLDYLLTRSTNLFFKQTSLLSDYGWIFPDQKEEKYLGFDYFTSDYKKFNFPTLCNIFVYVGKKNESTVREYPKIQSVIAETGGLLNFFILLFGSISKVYSINHLKLKVVNSINEAKLDFKKSSNTSNILGNNTKQDILNIKSFRDDCKSDLSQTKNQEDCKLSKMDITSLYEIKKDQISIPNSNIHPNSNTNHDLNSRQKPITNPILNQTQTTKLEKFNPFQKIEDKSRDEIENSIFNNVNVDVNLVDLYSDKFPKLKEKVDNYKLLDDLKNIEDKTELSSFEPFKLLFYQNFSFLSKSQENKDYYDKITKEYDSYFEFHNMMLLEHKIKILADIVFDTKEE